MGLLKRGRLLPSLALLSIVLLSLAHCVTAVEPVYSLRDGFLFIDGKLSILRENSYLRASTGVRDGLQYSLEEVELREVATIDGDGNSVMWEYLEDRSVYVPPVSFTPVVGQQYYVTFTTETGKVYESTPEVMQPVSELENFQSTFVQESYLNDDLASFVPAFELSGSFQDDPEQRNFYRFTYSSWEQLIVCLTCNFSQFRPGETGCIETSASRFVPRYDYGCDTNCWERTEHPEFSLFSDEFTNGSRIENFNMGQIDYDWFGGILVIARLEKISAEAYEYNRVLRDQRTGSGGLNATLPASLNGNLSILNRDAGDVLGYFAVVAESEQRIYFNRDTVRGQPLPFDNNFSFDVTPPAPLFPCQGSNRSSQSPEGWPE